MSAPQALVGGRYRLIEVIAHGGMGVVWKARDERLDRPVAVKQLRTHPGITEREAEVAKNRAIREAHITAQLAHPHAVPVLDAVEHEGQPCLVMPYLPSTPLSAVLRKRTTLPLPDVLRIGAQTASALAAAHRLRIVHRDVKPGNVLITGDGTAHLSDFGISHAMGDATLTDTGFLHGTPAYLSPEVARGGSAVFASDVFSLGSTLYAALEGAPPFGSDQNPIALLHKVAAAKVDPPAHAGALTPLLLQMLAEQMQDRPTMDVVAASLAQLRASPPRPAPARPEAAPPPSSAQPSSAVLATWFPPARGASTEPLAEGAATAVAPHAVTGSSAAGAVPDDRARTRRRALWGLGSLAALVAGVLALSTLTGQLGQEAPRSAGDGQVLPTSSATTSVDTAEPSSAEAAAPTSAQAAAPTSAEQTSAPAPTADPAVAAPSPTSDPGPEPEVQPETTDSETSPSAEQDEVSQDRAGELTSAITGYYALMPNNTDAAWPRMTADYQSNHAGGRAAYDFFWGNVEAISVSDVQPDPPDRAQATLTYSFSDGGTRVERTTYRFVDDGGSLRIAESDVLSSSDG